MELYHNNMSVCAQKVRLVIAEKGLNAVEHHMMLRNGDVHTPEYLKLNPKGVVPTLIDGGEAIVESTIICEYLDEAYPQHPLRPRDPVARARMREWTQWPDAGLHDACGTLSVAVAWRHQMLAAGGAQLANRPARAGQTTQLRNIVEQGLDSEHVPPALQTYDAVIEKMARTLAKSAWLAGDDYSLADAAMTPYVCRLEDLGLDWFWAGDRSAVGDWLRRVKARPNFSGIADYYLPAYVALATEKGREATPRLKAILGVS